MPKELVGHANLPSTENILRSACRWLMSDQFTDSTLCFGFNDVFIFPRRVDPSWLGAFWNVRFNCGIGQNYHSCTSGWWKMRGDDRFVFGLIEMVIVLCIIFRVLSVSLSAVLRAQVARMLWLFWMLLCVFL